LEALGEAYAKLGKIQSCKAYFRPQIIVCFMPVSSETGEGGDYTGYGNSLDNLPPFYFSTKTSNNNNESRRKEDSE